jgi:hypothetical protein
VSDRRGRNSRAYSKTYGTTEVSVENSVAEVQKLLTRAHLPHQVENMPDVSISVRWRYLDKNYLLKLPQFEDDPQENRRLLRVAAWYVKTMLAVLDADLFDDAATVAMLGLLELTPNVTLSEALGDPDTVREIGKVLGGGQLALGAGR